MGELPSDLVEGNGFDSISGDIHAAINDVLQKYHLELTESEMVSHDTSREHFTKCSQCSSWMFDRTREENREDVDSCIKNGATYNDQQLCSDCLPADNTWAWTHD